MTGQPIGVGIIGASADGWAGYAHLPALAALPDFEIRAVSTTRRASAEAAASAFGATHAFTSYQELVQCSDVDLVVVSVKVPDHYALVSAAIEAGKDVYCEWPLGLDEQEGQKLADAARDAGIRSVVGLQSRSEPAINTVRDLIAAGELGEILSTTMVGAVNPGNSIDPRNVYMAERSSGANVFTISGGHSMDAFCYTLGEFEHLQAVLDTRVPLLNVEGTDEQVRKTAPDQIAVVGKLTSGAVASVHLRENMRGISSFVWEINGTSGTVRLTAPHAHPGFYPLTVTISREGDSEEQPVTIDPLYGVPEASAAAVATLIGSPASNVARTYARYADDIRTGASSVPSFDDAVVRHKLISAIEASGYGDVSSDPR